MLQHKPRIEDRTKVMIRARLRGTGPERDACIVDVSSRGLSASADDAPKRGEFVELVVGDIILLGQVKWSSMRRFGMSFRERISVVGLLSGDGDAVGLKDREVARKRDERKVASLNGGGLLKKLEFLVIVIAGAAATFMVADYAFAALRPLDEARIAMAASDG